MNTKEYVQSLFSDYEETENLKNFMEEIQSNLDARVASLVRKGLAEQDAFDKACTELGDISVLAKEFSLKKRREVFEEVYMDVRKYMTPRRVAAYVIFGVIAVLGIIIAFISFFVTRVPIVTDISLFPGWPFDEARSVWPFGKGGGILVFTGTLFPFIVAAIAGFTFLGVTQETRTHFPLSRKRAAWYTVAAGLISFGLFVTLLTYFAVVPFDSASFVNMAWVATLIPFVLPGGGILCYLLLTEKKRFKPWAASLHEKTVKQEMEMWEDPATASRFGMLSGAIWIFALALFFLLGFLVGFRYSWVIFIFAVGIQLLVQGLMMKKKI